MSQRLRKAASRQFTRMTGKPVAVKTALNGKDILHGFAVLSHRIARNGMNPTTIVVSGGACSVLLLENRSTTKDVDFFSSDPEAIRNITSAKNAAAGDIPEYPHGWINAEMIAYVSNLDGCQHLFDTSVQSNMVLYQSAYLRVFAADWKYQFVGKVKRVFDLVDPHHSQSEAQRLVSESVHMLDAVHILRQLVRTNTGYAISLSRIRSWYYDGSFMTAQQATVVNGYYRNMFPGSADAIDIRK